MHTEETGRSGGRGRCRGSGRRQAVAWAARFVAGDGDGGYGGGVFGVRRPLRYMARALDLDESQVAALATIMNELKTERAQASVDQRRSTSAFADALEGDEFDEAAVHAAASGRVKTAENLRDAVVRALGKTHALLRPEQRAKLAYLLRSGGLTI